MLWSNVLGPFMVIVFCRNIFAWIRLHQNPDFAPNLSHRIETVTPVVFQLSFYSFHNNKCSPCNEFSGVSSFLAPSLFVLQNERTDMLPFSRREVFKSPCVVVDGGCLAVRVFDGIGAC